MPSCKELRNIAKELSIRGYSKMNKSQLTSAIEGDSDPEVESTPDSPEESESPAHLKLKVPKEEKTARKSTSKWVAFCKEFSKENGVSYKTAMSKKDEYEVWKSALAEKAEQLSPVAE